MTFKFRKGLPIFAGISALIFAIFSAISIKQVGLNENSATLLFGLAFFLILSLLSYSLTMDLKLDDEGISKLFRGKPALFLKWSDVKVIKDVESGFGGGTGRTFYVIPKAAVSLSFWSGRWIRFPAMLRDFRAFADEMNKHIRANNIAIERTRNREVVPCDEITVRDKPTFKLPGSTA